jgi:CHAT domain-containing protein/uncharacterized protein HemY
MQFLTPATQIAIALLLGITTPLGSPLAIAAPSRPIAQTSPAAQNEGDRAFQAGKKALNAGENEKAIQWFQQAARRYAQQKQTRSQVYTLWQLAQVLHQIGRYAEAIDVLKQAQPLVGKDLELKQGIWTSRRIAHVEIASAYAKQKQYQAALQEYEIAKTLAQEVSDSSGIAGILLSIANLYRDQQQFQKAIAPLQEALRLTPDSESAKAVQTFVLGRVYDDLSDYRTAIATYQKAVTLARNIGDRGLVVSIFNNLAAVYGTQGDYQKALDIHQEGLKISRELQQQYREIVTPSNYDRLCSAAKSGEKTMPNQLMAKFCDTNLPRAVLIEQFNKTRSLYVQQNRQLEASSLTNAGILQLRLGQPEQALKTQQAALNLNLALQDQSGEATAYNNIGNIHIYQGNYNEAISSFQKSLTLNRQLNQPNQIAITINNLAQVYDRQGNLRLAAERYQESLAITRTVGDRQSEATVLGNLGTISQNLGDYGRSLQEFETALQIYRSLDSKAGEMVTLSNISVVHSILGDYSKALQLQEAAYNIAKSIGDREKEAVMLDNLGRIYDDQAQYAKGLEYHEKAIAIQRQIGDRSGESGTLLSMGLSYRRLGRYNKARDAYQASLDLSKSLGDRYRTAIALTGMGSIMTELGEFDQAIGLIQQGLAIHREIGTRRGEIGTLKVLGHLYKQKGYQQKGDLPKALQSFDEGLKIAQALGTKPEAAEMLAEIGGVQVALGQHSQAQVSLRQTEQQAQTLGDSATRGKALTSLGESLLATGKTTEAEQVLTTAIQLWESQRPGLTDSDKVSLFDIQERTYRLLQRSLVSQNRTDAALEISERGRARAFIELLATRMGDRGQQWVSKAPTLAEIRQIAQAQKATLVQYSIISDQELYIWVIQPNGTIRFHKRPLTTAIAQLVQDSRDSLDIRGQRSSRTPTPTIAASRSGSDLKQLHEILIAPIQADLPAHPNQRVIFAPQGALFLVPFAALENSQGQMVIDRHTISFTPSLQALQFTQQLQRRQTGREALIVGNPTMPLYGDVPLEPLPGAEAEAKQIGAILQSQPLIGSAATKNAVVNRMKTSGVIHLATHGLLDTLRGDIPGAIALTPSGDDGYLTAGEILDLRLQADLVVLSACSTGRGDITGDGVIGLSRSLFIAGVPSVVVSLWNVKDESTALLMTEFYRALQSGQRDKAQALRQAMITTRQKYPNPNDWAAFTLVGEAD